MLPARVDAPWLFVACSKYTNLAHLFLANPRQTNQLFTRTRKMDRRTRLPLRESHAFLILRVLDFLKNFSQVFHAPRDFSQVCKPRAGNGRRV